MGRRISENGSESERERERGMGGERATLGSSLCLLVVFLKRALH